MAQLKDGTRIYGNATIDSTLYVAGGNISLGTEWNATSIQMQPGPGGVAVMSSNNNNNFVVLDNSSAYIYTDYSNNEYEWQFDSAGNLSVPGWLWPSGTDGTIDLGKSGNSWRDIHVTGTVGPVNSVTIGTGGSQLATAGSNVLLTATSNSWTFGSDATLSWPDTTVQNTAYRISRSEYDVAGPSAVLDSLQIGVNVGWQPYLTCVGVATMNGGVSGHYTNQASSSPLTQLGSVSLVENMYSYFNGSLTFAVANESLTAIVTNYDTGQTYNCSWYATSSGKGYVSIQQI